MLSLDKPIIVNILADYYSPTKYYYENKPPNILSLPFHLN